MPSWSPPSCWCRAMSSDDRSGRPLRHEVAALERTALAWERTAMSLGAVGLLLVKVVDGGRATQAAGLALVAMAALVVLVMVMVPWGYQRACARVGPGAPEQPFAQEDRWRPRMLLASACAISCVAVTVAVDLWLTGAI